MVGAVVIVGGLLAALAMCFFYRYKRNMHQTHQPSYQQPPVSTVPPSTASPPPASETSRPTFSTTPSTQPLTQAALADLSPEDSASQLGGYNYNSPNSPQQQFNGSQAPQSSLGTLPQFQQQNPGVYGHQGPESSVMTPGSAFGSMPPVRAPGIPSPGPGPVPSPPQVPNPGHEQRGVEAGG